ncbi:AAA family ATPase [Paenibacillus sp. HWE-109]|uniref:AAA family ATPase n=1 Tax=Paenibacillus sp. HWE-109 TaxID=1306526 RepID=UPI001EDD5001|nr:AAA family ATPase [Paenibacillus sp. HWE-109]UKS23953.1 AAA family ATPase [Paenibacillus sp. HWE-109]
MRIVAIQVDGFGSLRQRQLDTNNSVVVFYGANEAGKSTLMGFVRAVLFGFPTRQNRSERYEPLGGGAHGGSLTLMDSHGQLIRVERYDAPAAGGKRASAGHVKVTLGDGTTGGEELLNTLLGGLSADLFRSLFAFGLTELQELRTLQTDELSGYLYSAGLGVSGSAIMEAERKLTAQADGLYRPRGRNQEMNRLLKELEGLEQSLRRSKDQAADYDRLQAERRSAEARIAALEQQQEALRAEQQKLSLAGKARSGWVRLRQIGQELAELPALASFPEHASARLEALEAELERVHADRTRLQLRKSELESQLHALEIQPKLLEHQVELNHLLEQAAAYEDQKRSRDQLRVEQDHQQSQLDRLLKQIDAQGEENAFDLSTFSVSISLREQIRAYKEQFLQCRADELRVQTELDSLEHQLARLQELIRGIESDLRKMPAMTGTVDPLTALQRISGDYTQWQWLVRDAEHQQEREAVQQQFQLSLEEAARAGKSAARKLRQRILILSGILAIIVPFVAIWQGNPLFALLLFVLLAGAACFIFLTDRQSIEQRSARVMPSVSDRREQRADHERGLHDIERRLREQIQAFEQQQAGYHEAAATVHGLKITDHSFNADLSGFKPQLDAWIREAEQSKQHLNEHRRKLDKLQEAKENRHALEQQADQRQGQLERVEEENQQLQLSWRQLLQSLGLAASLSPDAALESLQLIELGQESLRQLHKLTAKADALVVNIQQYEDQVAQRLELARTAREESVYALKSWKDKEQEQLKQLAKKQHCEQLCVDNEQDQLLLGATEERIQERLRLLLQEANARDREELRIHQRQQEERRKLAEEQKLLEASLVSLLSTSQFDAYTELLDQSGEEEMAQQLAVWHTQLSESLRESNEWREVIGKLDGQIEKLEQGTEHADKLLKLEDYRATLHEQVDQYAVASFASLLLKKAREVYEKERQPGVLLRASDYFAQMTNGAFSQVKAPFGEQRLVAFRANGQAVETNQLSRGTAEQLYLAMRFALVEEYAGKAVLPLVMDDILVNFDEERMVSCLRVLAEISRRHQVLLFTCHGHVQEAAARVIPDHAYINLSMT